MVAFDISFCVQSCLCLIGIQYVFSQPSATFDHSCYKTGDTAVLTMSYSPTGSETVTVINWYFSKATGNNAIDTSCNEIAEDSAFPNARIEYDCTDSASNRFKATVSNIEEADFGEWGASFGLSAGGPTNTAKVDMTRCGKIFMTSSLEVLGNKENMANYFQGTKEHG